LSFISDPEVLKIIAIIIGAMSGGGGVGFGVRQYLLKRQNGNSISSIIKTMVSNQDKTTKLLYKMDRKLDTDRVMAKKDLEMQKEREVWHKDQIKNYRDEVKECFDRIEDHLKA